MNEHVGTRTKSNKMSRIIRVPLEKRYIFTAMLDSWETLSFFSPHSALKKQKKYAQNYQFLKNKFC